MGALYPDRLYHRIWDIPAGLLHKWGIRALALDIDNTLTTHNNPVPDRRVLEWLDLMKALGMKLVIISNNYSQRVEPFARALGLDYTARAWKPSPKGFRETAERLAVEPGEMALIGDQIFTDILGGNLFGCKTILVEPMEPEKGLLFRLKRLMERGVLKKYRRLAGYAEESGT